MIAARPATAPRTCEVEGIDWNGEVIAQATCTARRQGFFLGFFFSWVNGLKQVVSQEERRQSAYDKFW